MEFINYKKKEVLLILILLIYYIGCNNKDSAFTGAKQTLAKPENNDSGTGAAQNKDKQSKDKEGKDKEEKGSKDKDDIKINIESEAISFNKTGKDSNYEEAFSSRNAEVNAANSVSTINDNVNPTSNNDPNYEETFSSQNAEVNAANSVSTINDNVESFSDNDNEFQASLEQIEKLQKKTLQKLNNPNLIEEEFDQKDYDETLVHKNKTQNNQPKIPNQPKNTNKDPQKPCNNSNNLQNNQEFTENKDNKKKIKKNHNLNSKDLDINANINKKIKELEKEKEEMLYNKKILEKELIDLRQELEALNTKEKKKEINQKMEQKINELEIKYDLKKLMKDKTIDLIAVARKKTSKIASIKIKYNIENLKSDLKNKIILKQNDLKNSNIQIENYDENLEKMRRQLRKPT